MEFKFYFSARHVRLLCDAVPVLGVLNTPDQVLHVCTYRVSTSGGWIGCPQQVWVVVAALVPEPKLERETETVGGRVVRTLQLQV